MRNHLLLSSAARLGLHGRVMKDGEGHGGAGGAPAGGMGDSQQGGNNQQGNFGQQGNADGNQNNSGQQFNPAQFWDDPSPAASPPARESAGSESGGGGSPQNPGNEAGKRFADTIAAAKFDASIFTPEALEAINQNSDPSLLNQNMEKFGQNVMRQTTLLAAQLMQAHSKQMMAQFESMMNQQFGNREADADLVRAIPSAANPAVAPMVKAIFQRAMSLSNGNRAGAIDMTKEMLKFQSQHMRGDLGLDTPPSSDRAIPNSDIDWVTELVGR